MKRLLEFELIVEGRPVPLARGRHGHTGRPRNTEESLEYQSRVIRAARRAMKEKHDVVNDYLFPFGKMILVETTFVGPRVRESDVDNLLKNAMDGLTKAGLWKDDKQVDAARPVRVPSIQGEWTHVYARAWLTADSDNAGLRALHDCMALSPSTAAFARFAWQKE